MLTAHTYLSAPSAEKVALQVRFPVERTPRKAISLAPPSVGSLPRQVGLPTRAHLQHAPHIHRSTPSSNNETIKYHSEEDGRRAISEQGFSRKWKKTGERQ